MTDRNFEVGWKTTDWFDGHVHTELDAFYTQYYNFQVILSNPQLPDPSTTDEYNLPGTTVEEGLEGEAQATFGQFSGTASLGLLKSNIGNIYERDGRQPGAFGTCNLSTGGADPLCVNLKGHPITYAPSATYNIALQYIFNLDNGDTLTPRVSFAHTSGQWASLFDNVSLGDRLNARNPLGGQLAYQTGDWIVSLYGDNLTDEQYITANDSGGLYAGAPRTFGIRAFKTF